MDGPDASDGRSGTTTDSREDDERRVEVHPGREAIVAFDPALTFECVPECTWCCHHGVLLSGPELAELAERASISEATTRFRGEDFVRREPKDRTDHVADDGHACYFLDDEGLCSLQVEYDWKPSRCSVFPLSVTREGDALRVSIRESAREHCEGLDVSDRRLVDHLDAFLPELLWELHDPDTHREL